MPNPIQKLSLISLLLLLLQVSATPQAIYTNFSSIPKSGTVLMYTHQDDDLIWMLPFWEKTEKFICAAMPTTPRFEEIIHDQQEYLDHNGYDIPYESNWILPWGAVTNYEYQYYYWNRDTYYSYLEKDHVIASWSDSDTETKRGETNKIKAKIEQYIADPAVSRIITHNNWGEYGHSQHKAVNLAVRELAVKYRKDVWMLGCDNGGFVDVVVPSGMTYTLGNYNGDLFDAIRQFYLHPDNWWTWYTTSTPTGDHTYIKIVDKGNDMSNVLTGETITVPGAAQYETGAYIFDGTDDYMTLTGNNNTPFTIAMRVKPDEIKAMDISKMAEYPLSGTYDRSFYLQSDGRVTASINDGQTRYVSSSTSLIAGQATHILMTGNGSTLKIYINGEPEDSISAGSAISSYTTPEFVLGQALITGSFFKGQISDVRFYDYAMSAAEISNLFGSSSSTTFAISSSAGTGGTISPSGETTLPQGTSQTYKIAANSGYQISDVMVDNISEGAISSYTFSNVSANHTITATFAAGSTYTINASAGTGGTISPSGTTALTQGSSQTFTITPSSGYQVSGVLVDNISVGAVSAYVFNNVAANHTIAAFFSSLSSSIALNKTATCQSYQGTKVASKANDSDGTNNSYWSADPYSQWWKVDLENTYDITSIVIRNYVGGSRYYRYDIQASMDDVTYTQIVEKTSTSAASDEGDTYNVTATARYLKVNMVYNSANYGVHISDFRAYGVVYGGTGVYTIASSAGTGGTITPSGSTQVNRRESQPYSINANSGYAISDVLVDGISAGALSTYTFSNVNANHTITALFSPNAHTINSSFGAGGKITPSGSVSVTHGEAKTFTIAPDSGYKVSDVLADSISKGALTTYTFSNITANHTIHASFSALPAFALISSAGTGGTISPSGSATQYLGAAKTYTITPDSGYQVSDVLVDSISKGALTTYTFSNITANHTIQASFSVVPYFVITATAGNGGSISPSGSTMARRGAAQTFTITSSSGYKVSNVLVDDISAGPLASYTFTNINANHTIEVSFAVNSYAITANAGNGGIISPAGTISLIQETSQTYVITPASGFEILKVLVDNVSMGALTSYTFRNINANHTIAASFTSTTSIALNKTSTCQSYQSTRLASNANDSDGTNSSIWSADPYSQWWKVDLGNIYDITSVVVRNYVGARYYQYNIQASTDDINYTKIAEKTNTSLTTDAGDSYNITVTARYLKVNMTYNSSNTGVHISDFRAYGALNGGTSAYTITSSAGSGGTIGPAGTNTVSQGASQTYTITPTTGYQVSGVLVDNVPAGALTSYIFSNVTANHTITASFSATVNNYTITSNAGTGGTISPSGTTTVSQGASQTFTIAPNTDYQVYSLLVDNVSAGAQLTYTFNNINANHTIEASFSLLSSSIALDKPATCQSYQGTRVASKANDSDGSNSSYWSADPYSRWWKVDLENTYTISSIVIRNYVDGSRYYKYDIQASTDDVTYTAIVQKTSTNVATDEGDTYSTSVIARYLKVNMTYNSANYGVHIADFRAYGTVSGLKSTDPESALPIRDEDIKVIVYPNPFHKIFTLKIESSNDELYTVSISDLCGRLLFLGEKITGNTENRFELKFNPGIYILKVESPETSKLLRIITN